MKASQKVKKLEARGLVGHARAQHEGCPSVTAPRMLSTLGQKPTFAVVRSAHSAASRRNEELGVLTQ